MGEKERGKEYEKKMSKNEGEESGETADGRRGRGREGRDGGVDETAKGETVERVRQAGKGRRRERHKMADKWGG